MAIEASGINGKKIYANHAYKDSNNNVITATYEHKIDYGFSNNKIITINGSALSAEDIYIPGDNINITNQIISGKSWIPEINSASADLENQLLICSSLLDDNLNLSATNLVNIINNTSSYLNDELTTSATNLNNKIDNVNLNLLTKLELSANNLESNLNSAVDNLNNTISSNKLDIETKLTNTQNLLQNNIDTKYDASAMVNYYTITDMNTILSNSGSYLSSTSLDTISGDWNNVYSSVYNESANWNNKLYTSSFNEQISSYYLKTETSSKEELNDKFITKQDNLTLEQLSSISSVSSLENDLHTNYYTSSDLNERLNNSGTYLSANVLDSYSGNWNNVYTSVNTTSANWNEISAKWDKSLSSNYYLKTETSSTDELNNKFNTKQNNLTDYQLSSISSVSSINNDLHTNYYTKTEVDEAISNFGGFEVHATLEEITQPKTNVIYLIGPNGTGKDKYEEYIYSNNEFVLIGDTTVDLSNYYQKTETSSTSELISEFNKKQNNLTDYQLSSISSVSSLEIDLHTNYYTSTYLNERLNNSGTYLSANALDSYSGTWETVINKLDTSSFDSAISSYYKKTETSSTSELINEFNTKQDNLSTQQLSSISSVSSLGLTVNYNNEIVTISFGV